MKTLSTERSSSSEMPHLVEGQGAVGEEPVEEGVGHRPGLLVDLLAHEVVVAVLASGVEVPLDGAACGIDLRAVERW